MKTNSPAHKSSTKGDQPQSRDSEFKLPSQGHENDPRCKPRPHRTSGVTKQNKLLGDSGGGQVLYVASGEGFVDPQRQEKDTEKV